MLRDGMGGTERTADDEPAPDKGLPPGKAGAELRRATARPPELHGESDTAEVKAGDATLPPLPAHANH